jgi:hypothetical protein
LVAVACPLRAYSGLWPRKRKDRLAIKVKSRRCRLSSRCLLYSRLLPKADTGRLAGNVIKLRPCRIPVAMLFAKRCLNRAA